MGGVSPTTSTCLDLTISVPGSSSVTDFKTTSLRLSKGLEPEANWINIGCPNSSEEAEDVDTDSPNPPPRKKLRLSKEQSRLLEDTFRQNHTLNPKQKEELALRLNLRPRQVEVWFQNRRARCKLKQTEVECEYLKRWFGSLSEQNQKLQRELEELRAVKLGPNAAREPIPGPSLSMCPRCERVSPSSAHVDKPTYGPSSTDTVAAAVECRQSSAAF